MRNLRNIPILSHHNPQEKILYFRAGHSPNDIVDHLNNHSCNDFAMCNDGYGKNKNSRRLICRRGRVARTSKGTTKMSATQLPTSHDEKCTFSFTINRDVHLDRWYVRQHNKHCWAHWGHPCQPRELQYDRIRDIPEETLETAKALLSQLIPYSIVGQYIETEAGATLTPGSLAWLRQTVLEENYSDGSDKNQSTAQKLILILDSTEGMAYVTYTGKPLQHFCRNNRMALFMRMLRTYYKSFRIHNASYLN